MSAPRLPLELIWCIVEETILQLSHKTGVIMAPTHLITLNRIIHTLVIKLVYKNIVLSSSRSLGNFLSLLSDSPKVAHLVHNLWIGTSRLEAFPHQIGWVPCTVGRILEKTPNLKRLALPASFFPLGLSESLIKHMTVNGGSIVELPDKIHVLHTFGLAYPSVVLRPRKQGLKRVVCEIRRPCAPGRIEGFVREVMEGDGPTPALVLIVSERLKFWLDQELVEVQDRLIYGTLDIHVKDQNHSEAETPCDEWLRSCLSLS